MFSLQYRSLLMVLALAAAGVGCASTQLEVPKDAAANPTAHSMPVAGGADSLREDFDPASLDANSAADPHAHHHHGGAESASPERTTAPTTSSDPHAGHQHGEPASEPTPSNMNSTPHPTPKSDAAEHSGQGDVVEHEGHHHE